MIARCRMIRWLLLLGLALASFGAQAQYRWPTLQFEVFAGNPYALDSGIDVDWLEMEDLIGGISDATRHDIERAMHEAAVWYQARGFPPPVIGDIVDTDDGRAYRIYVCSRDWDQAAVDFVFGAGFVLNFAEWEQCGYDPIKQTSSAAYYTPDCPQVTSKGRRSKLIVINADASLDANGRLTELGYQTLAHEMLHAIMPNTVLGRSDPDCKKSKWISEGIADAVGWDIAEELWAHRYVSSMQDSDITKRWGYRPYFERLPQQGDVGIPGLPSDVKLDAGYHTSSFWRFIADAYPKGWNVMVSAGRSGPPGLLDLPLEGTGWRSEVNWIDKGLRGKFNYGLDAMFGSFVGYFSYSIPPFKRYRGKNPESQEVVAHWTNLLFEQCASVNLTSGGQQKVNLKIKGLGARCIWVEPTGRQGAIQVTFQAGHDDLSLLDDIWISRPGTTLLVRASMTGQLPNGPTQYIATWKDFPQDGNERTLYVVSNVARKPDQSKPREIDLTVSLPSNTNSARGKLPPRKYVPPPEKPSHEKHAKSLSRRNSETRNMINEQMNEDKKSLSENVSHATRISRQLNIPDCPRPFLYSPCGPQMSISLSVMPGTYIMPGQVNAQGGMAAQVMGGLQAMATTSAFDTQPVMEELVAKIEAIDGSSVSIVTPLFDYGFSGSFDNAQIGVTMRGGKHYSAFGPPDASGNTPLTGQVTIEEYTPYTVRGSFVAPLAEFVLSPSGEPVYTPRETVTGTFMSVAPWQEDERVQVVQDSTEVMADDIMNSLGVPAGTAWSLKQQGKIPGTSAAPSAGGGGGGSGSAGGGALQTNECTCECETKPFADDLCALLCEEEFAACKDP